MTPEEILSGAPAASGFRMPILCSGLIVAALVGLWAFTGEFMMSAMVVAGAPLGTIASGQEFSTRNWLFDTWVARNRFRTPDRWRNH